DRRRCRFTSSQRVPVTASSGYPATGTGVPTVTSGSRVHGSLRRGLDSFGLRAIGAGEVASTFGTPGTGDHRSVFMADSITASADNRAVIASSSHGRPAIAATAKPVVFSGRDVVAARAAAPNGRAGERPATAAPAARGEGRPAPRVENRGESSAGNARPNVQRTERPAERNAQPEQPRGHRQPPEQPQARPRQQNKPEPREKSNEGQRGNERR